MRVLSDRVLASCLEVDLLEKGIDLLDLYRGKLTWTRVIRVMRTFGPESHLSIEVGHREVGDAVYWNSNEHLLAYIANSSQYGNYLQEMNLYLKSDGKGKKPQPPEPIRPPGYQPPPPMFTPLQEAVDFFNSYNKGG